MKYLHEMGAIVLLLLLQISNQVRVGVEFGDVNCSHEASALDSLHTQRRILISACW